MSTNLYGIRVLQKVPQYNKVRLRVCVVSYDTDYKTHQPLPKDHSFFLRVLWDKGDIRFGEGGPIGETINVDQFLDEKWVDKHTYQYISSVKQISTKNYPINASRYHEYLDVHCGTNGIREKEELLVQADYEVYVTDEKYIMHLFEGMSWGTTAYETKALIFNLEHASSLPNIKAEVHSLKAFEGEKETGTCESIQYSGDGAQLFAISQNNEICAFEQSTWKEIWRQKCDGMFARFYQDENSVWLQNYRKTIGYWNAETGETEHSTQFTAYRSKSPNGTYLVNYGEDNKLAFVDQGGASIWEVPQANTVEAVAFTKDEKIVAIGGMYGHIELWDTDKCVKIKQIPFSEERTTCLSFNQTGQFLAISLSHGVEIYAVNSGQLVLRYLDDKKDYWETVLWSPDGKYFLVNLIGGGTGYGGGIKIFQIGDKN